MGDHELIFSTYPNIYLPLLVDICHLCIRIIHTFVFVNVNIRSFSAHPDLVSARQASGHSFVAKPSNPTVFW
jgi:hypothetical protein